MVPNPIKMDDLGVFPPLFLETPIFLPRFLNQFHSPSPKGPRVACYSS